VQNCEDAREISEPAEPLEAKPLECGGSSAALVVNRGGAALLDPDANSGNHGPPKPRGLPKRRRRPCAPEGTFAKRLL